VLYDFHSHTFHSDGVLSPIELIRRAAVRGYCTLGITDHVGVGSLKRLIKEVGDDCRLARSHWNIMAMPGVELTHLPPGAIDEAARKAKELGAWLVVVHGETPVEPVEKGTNLAAVKSHYVDILAHPGHMTAETARIAAENGVFIEITTRRGHCTTNAHVARVAGKAGALMLLDTDSHDENDLLSDELARETLTQAGISSRKFKTILEDNPLKLIQRIKRVR
jgi:putative hydrolase